MLRVDYFPIGAETLTAVTPETIHARGDRYTFSDPRQVATIRKLLASATKPHDAKVEFAAERTRIRIVDEVNGHPAVILVDNEGVVRFPAGDKQLSPTALKALADLLDNE